MHGLYLYVHMGFVRIIVDCTCGYYASDTNVVTCGASNHVCGCDLYFQYNGYISKHDLLYYQYGENTA